ncbi:MAG: hypothetical protein GQ574_19660 [Crocinitomix sp.]|nr:hypothetical protein [Crocinitomix sp.]
MITALHKIEKQRLNITYSANQNLSDIQIELAQICSTTLPAVLDKICNQICMDDYTISLDKISLDLGEISMASLEEDLIEKVTNQLQEVLLNAIRIDEVSFTETELKRTKTVSIIDIVTCFLSTGNLPVWIKPHSVNLSELFDKVLTNNPETVAHFLQRSGNLNDISKRFIQISSKGQFEKLILILTEKPVIIDFVADLSKVLKSAAELFKLSIPKLKELVLLAAIESGLDALPLKKLLRYILKKSASIDHAPIDLKLIESSIITQVKKGIQFKSNLPELITSIIKDNKSKDIQLDTKKRRTDTKQSSVVKQCTIQNAGLVLLWPGLTFLFAESGLTVEDSFINEAAQERAVLLLQYTLGDQSETIEYDLPLNKLLCGLDITASLGMDFSPTKKEKETVEKLLTSIIAEWKALKGSSSKGLQETYLNRVGTLVKKDNDWLLEIERQTWDVLIDKLPWGIGIVKLPWMENMIHTEW